MSASIATTVRATAVAIRFKMSGRVQGIGTRPAIARLALQCSLTGFVDNTCEGVEIHVEGSVADLERFEQSLQACLPDQAEVTALRRTIAKVARFESFQVGKVPEAQAHDEDRPPASPAQIASARVPIDVVVCDDCLRETADESNHRHRYPFTSCTNCGPRYSIINRMPYERSDTTMAEFSLCPQCRHEYQSAADRRFHAQTNACPHCGPRCWLRESDGRIAARDFQAVSRAATAIRDGKIVALKGLGGYQLLVDATSEDVVIRLRQRKQRRGKPLAVLVASLSEAETIAQLDESEKRLLSSPAGPIVVAIANPGSILARAVTGGLNSVGLMLPTTPLHWLLLDIAQRPLVCTSGNVDGEPLAYESDDAFVRLGGIADLWLEHDRVIRRPIDDSVVRIIAGQPVTIRLGRGYAPLPLDVLTNQPMIALGGHQKAAIAVGNTAQSLLGPHIGDLDTISVRRRFEEQSHQLSELYGISSRRVVCDSHPDFFTTELAERNGPEVIRVQHHHAHIVAGMLEYGWFDRQVFGVSFDGTGYGTDATIWGGEFLLATAASFKRIAHLRPFLLPGGEQAVRQPWRVATALVHDALGTEEATKLRFETGDPGALLPVLKRPHLSTMTTSAGRLFDGIAALALGVEQNLFEGQAAILLEQVCDLASPGDYAIPIEPSEPMQLDWRPLVRQIVRERKFGVPAGEMAMRFHRGLANAILEVGKSYSALPVVLAGGVFQNRVLTELLAERLCNSNRPVGLPGRIPPNDGGLAAGQLAVAAAREKEMGQCV